MTYERDVVSNVAFLATKHSEMPSSTRDWRPLLYSSTDAQAEFRSIALQMPLAQIYEGTL